MPAPILRPTFAACLLFATSGVFAAALPCLVAGKADAEFSTREGPGKGYVSTSDCRSVQVIRGQVTVHFSGLDGKPVTQTLAPGERLNAAAGGGSKATNDVVARQISQLVFGNSSETVAGRKFYRSDDNEGLPFGEVYVPTRGLPVFAKPTEGAGATFVLSEAASGRILWRDKVSAHGEAAIPPGLFRPGARYELIAQYASGQAKSAFQIISTEDAQDIEAIATQLRDAAGLPAEAQAISLALLFEDRSLSYNRQLALRELKK